MPQHEITMVSLDSAGPSGSTTSTSSTHTHRTKAASLWCPGSHNATVSFPSTSSPYSCSTRNFTNSDYRELSLNHLRSIKQTRWNPKKLRKSAEKLVKATATAGWWDYILVWPILYPKEPQSLVFPARKLFTLPQHRKQAQSNANSLKSRRGVKWGIHQNDHINSVLPCVTNAPMKLHQSNLTLLEVGIAQKCCKEDTVTVRYSESWRYVLGWFSKCCTAWELKWGDTEGVLLKNKFTLLTVVGQQWEGGGCWQWLTRGERDLLPLCFAWMVFREGEQLSSGYSGACFFCICISTQGHQEQLESSYFVLFKWTMCV